MNVLVTHECSATIARAFRARGHNAWSNDILPTTSPGWKYHIHGDYKIALRWEKWDLLIGHPVCTYLCNSGAGRLVHTPPNPSEGVLYGAARWNAMRAAARHFYEMLYGHDIKRVCMENPVMHGHARRIIEDLIFTRHFPISEVDARRLARPTQTIQPNQFGDDASKRTGLWLRNLDPLDIDPAKAFPPRIVNGRPRWGNQTDSGQNKLTPSANRAALRSETYPGVAEAMAVKWGGE